MKFIYIYASAHPYYGNFHEESALLPVEDLVEAGLDIDEVVKDISKYVANMGWHEIAGKHSYTEVQDWDVHIYDTESFPNLPIPGGDLAYVLGGDIDLKINWREIDKLQTKVLNALNEKQEEVKSIKKEIETVLVKIRDEEIQLELAVELKGLLLKLEGKLYD